MRNLAPEVLADLLDLNYRTYLKIENGQRDLRVTEMIKLSEKLDIPPEWLYTQNSQSINFSKKLDNEGNSNNPHWTNSEGLLHSIHEVLVALLKNISE